MERSDLKMIDILNNNAFIGMIVTGVSFVLGCALGAFDLSVFENVMWICAASMLATAILSFAAIVIHAYQTRKKEDNDWR